MNRLLELALIHRKRKEKKMLNTRMEIHVSKSKLQKALQTKQPSFFNKELAKGEKKDTEEVKEGESA